jgi:hypothetical protein
MDEFNPCGDLAFRALFPFFAWRFVLFFFGYQLQNIWHHRCACPSET